MHSLFDLVGNGEYNLRTIEGIDSGKEVACSEGSEVLLSSIVLMRVAVLHEELFDLEFVLCQFGLRLAS